MAEFDRNVATWMASGITRYAFTYQPSCFCPNDPHLVVSDGTEVRIDGVAAGGTVSPVGAPVGVDGLFELARRAINGDHASFVYDPNTGVPMSMRSDPILNAIDDELSFEVIGWTLDPPNDRLLGEVSAARQLWQQQNILSYTWSIAIACDCVYDGRTFDVTVRDGDPTVRSGGKRIATDRLEGVPLTVTALFDFAVAGATMKGSTAEFTANLGYPTHVELHDDRPDAVQSQSIDVVAFSMP